MTTKHFTDVAWQRGEINFQEQADALADNGFMKFQTLASVAQYNDTRLPGFIGVVENESIYFNLGQSTVQADGNNVLADANGNKYRLYTSAIEAGQEPAVINARTSSAETLEPDHYYELYGSLPDSVTLTFPDPAATPKASITIQAVQTVGTVVLTPFNSQKGFFWSNNRGEGNSITLTGTTGDTRMTIGRSLRFKASGDFWNLVNDSEHGTSATAVPGPPGSDGRDGNTQLSAYSIAALNLTPTQVSAITNPTATSYNPTTGAITGLTTGWSLTQPSYDPSTHKLIVATNFWNPNLNSGSGGFTLSSFSNPVIYTEKGATGEADDPLLPNVVRRFWLKVAEGVQPSSPSFTSFTNNTFQGLTGNWTTNYLGLIGTNYSRATHDIYHIDLTGNPNDNTITAGPVQRDDADDGTDGQDGVVSEARVNTLIDTRIPAAQRVVSGGTNGQIYSRTSTGYAWINAPTGGGGGTTDSRLPTPSISNTGEFLKVTPTGFESADLVPTDIPVLTADKIPNISTAKISDIPLPNTGMPGQILARNSSGTSYELINAPTGGGGGTGTDTRIPTITTQDAGEYLRVNSSGTGIEYVAANPAGSTLDGRLPTNAQLTAGTAGQILELNSAKNGFNLVNKGANRFNFDATYSLRTTGEVRLTANELNKVIFIAGATGNASRNVRLPPNAGTNPGDFLTFVLTNPDDGNALLFKNSTDIALQNLIDIDGNSNINPVLNSMYPSRTFIMNSTQPNSGSWKEINTVELIPDTNLLPNPSSGNTGQFVAINSNQDDWELVTPHPRLEFTRITGASGNTLTATPEHFYLADGGSNNLTISLPRDNVESGDLIYVGVTKNKGGDVIINKVNSSDFIYDKTNTAQTSITLPSRTSRGTENYIVGFVAYRVSSTGPVDWRLFYEEDFKDAGLTQSEVDARVNTLVPVSQRVLSGGTNGQIYSRTSTGYAWIDAPTSGGGGTTTGAILLPTSNSLINITGNTTLDFDTYSIANSINPNPVLILPAPTNNRIGDSIFIQSRVNQTILFRRTNSSNQANIINSGSSATNIAFNLASNSTLFLVYAGGTSWYTINSFRDAPISRTDAQINTLIDTRIPTSERVLTGGLAGQYYTRTSSGYQWANLPSGTGGTDSRIPSLSGQAGKYIQVNSSADSFDFVDSPTPSGGTFGIKPTPLLNQNLTSIALGSENVRKFHSTNFIIPTAAADAMKLLAFWGTTSFSSSQGDVGENSTQGRTFLGMWTPAQLLAGAVTPEEASTSASQPYHAAGAGLHFGSSVREIYFAKSATNHLMVGAHESDTRYLRLEIYEMGLI